MNSMETVRKIRIAMCMEQVKLAKAIGVTKQTISNWERGRRAPTLSKIKALRDLCVKNKIEVPAIESFLN